MTKTLTNNWANLYEKEKLEKWGLPAFEIVDSEMGSINKLYVKFSELPTKTEDGNEIDLYTICADVLIIDKPVILNRSTYIFARRVEVVKDAYLTLDRRIEPVAFLLAAQEVVSVKGAETKLRIDVLTNSKTDKAWYEAKTNDPVTVLEWEDLPISKKYPISELEEAYLLEGEPLRIHLRCLFQLATLLSSDNKVLSVQQYNWVAALSTASNDTRTICGEAQSMASITARQIQNEGIILVPDLDYSIYTESAQAFLTLLNRRQDKQDKLQQSRDNNQNWLAAATDALQRNKNDEVLEKQLLDKAKSTRDKVLEARATVARQIAMQQIVLFKAERMFRAGIEIWRIDKFVEAIFKMIMGALKIFSAIPAMVVTGPSMGMSSVLSIVSTSIGLVSKGVGKTIGVAGRAPLAPSAGAGGIQVYQDARNYIQAMREDGQTRRLIDQLNSVVSTADLSPGGANLEDPLLVNYAGSAGVGLTDDERLDAMLADIDAIQVGNQDSVNNSVDYQNANQNDLRQIDLSQKELAAKQKAAQAEFAKGVKEIGEGTGEIMNAAMDLIAANEKAKNLEKASQSALLASNVAIDVTFSSLELEGLDVVTGGAQVWDYFAQQVEQLFENNPTLGQIEGGPTYRKEMNKLILLGKTYALTRLAVAKADAELAEMVMRERSSRLNVGIFQARMSELGDKAVDDATIAQLAFGKILDAKRSVYLAMEAYKRALIYFTLADEMDLSGLPKFYSSIDDFYEAGARIVGRRKANELLRDGPKTIPLNEYVVSKEKLPDTLFSDGAFNIPIETSTEWFNGMYRVRLDKVRMYPLGLKASSNIVVTIATSGMYEDKTRTNETKKFAASPLKAKFIYDANDPKNIRQDIEIAVRFKNDFYKPTPFTSWTIQVDQQNGRDLDYSLITGLRVVFSGEASNQ